MFLAVIEHTVDGEWVFEDFPEIIPASLEEP
jgi:hypothetical protein